MPEALHSGHAPLLDSPQPTTHPARPARVHVLRRRVPEVPPRPRWQDRAREFLEPLVFATTVVLAVLALGLWISPRAHAGQGRDLQAAPATTPAAIPAQAG